MSRRMIHGIALPLVLICLSAMGRSQDFFAPRPERSADSSFGYEQRKIDLFVQDDQGRGIAGVLVTFDDHWTTSTDLQGAAAIEGQPGMHLPLRVILKAAGFQAHQFFISSLWETCVVAHMERSGPPDAGSSLTVGAGELQHGIQEESRRLQEKAASLLRHGDYGQAEELLRQAVELTPSSASAHTNLGIIYLRRKELGQAAASFEKAAKAAPYNPLALGNLGLVRWMQGRNEESYELLSRADSQGYSTERGNYIIGVTALVKGLANSAVAHLKKVNPAKFVYRDLFLSLAERSRGNVKAADRTFSHFLHRGPAPLAVTILADDLLRPSGRGDAQY